jgi:hypothetical protein
MSSSLILAQFLAMLDKKYNFLQCDLFEEEVMANTKRKSGSLGKSNRKSTASTRTTLAMETQNAANEHIDGCSIEFHESEATPDAELPDAKGGIEISGAKRRPPLQRK